MSDSCVTSIFLVLIRRLASSFFGWIQAAIQTNHDVSGRDADGYDFIRFYSISIEFQSNTLWIQILYYSMSPTAKKSNKFRCKKYYYSISRVRPRTARWDTHMHACVVRRNSHRKNAHINRATLAVETRISMGDDRGPCHPLLPAALTLRLNDHRQSSLPPAHVILDLQPTALIDHIARVGSSLLDQIPGDRGGSQQVDTLSQ